MAFKPHVPTLFPSDPEHHVHRGAAVGLFQFPGYGHDIARMADGRQRRADKFAGIVLQNPIA